MFLNVIRVLYHSNVAIILHFKRKYQNIESNINFNIIKCSPLNKYFNFNIDLRGILVDELKEKSLHTILHMMIGMILEYQLLIRAFVQ